MSPAEILYWRGRTEAADVRGYFDEQDNRDANRWSTCAVGEKVQQFPKVVLLTMWDGPRDGVLERLGGDFGRVVEDSYETHAPGGWEPKYEHPILEAYRLLDLIDARVMVMKGMA